MPCLRCSGTLYKQSDIYGEYISCYQCGFLKDLSVVETLANVNLKEFGDRNVGSPIPSKAIQGDTSPHTGITDEATRGKFQARPPSRITKNPREYKKGWVQRKRRKARGPILPIGGQEVDELQSAG